MAKLHIFIDGSWLFKVCAPAGVLARDLADPALFHIDFAKLQKTILEHIKQTHPDCTEIGDCFNITSIFTIPPDFDTWVGTQINKTTISTINITKTRNTVNAREAFAQSAITAGFNPSGILHVNLKSWMIEKLINGKFQEKQVDTTLVALLVKYAITQKDDYFAVLAGDADILPAISIAYPEFTERLCLVTTHPDELDAAHRQTSFSYTQFPFVIEPLYLQNCVDKIMQGAHVHRCVKCKKLYSTLAPMPRDKQAHCKICRP